VAAILIVDDRAEIRTLLRAVVEREGYTAVLCQDAVAAREYLKGAPRPAVVFADVGLPNENGLQLAERLRAEPGMGSLPIVFITASPELVAGQKLPGDGPVGVVSKPFRFDQVARVIREVLGK
jgi:CheY-like chemotaxis protein